MTDTELRVIAALAIIGAEKRDGDESRAFSMSCEKFRSFAKPS
jgi:hypothetical protein